MAITFQTGIKTYNTDNTKYSLFLGGLDANSSSLAQYTPLRTGYGRIFFVKMPYFMNVLLPEQTKRVKHILEYGCTGIDGIGGTTLEFDEMTGGYAGRSLSIATASKDDTSEITLKLYEFSGSPVREYMEMWITGIADKDTGLAHYHNAVVTTKDSKGKETTKRVAYKQSNHIAEAFYVSLGPTGLADDIEYCCFLANMMPTGVEKSHFDFSAGEHRLVEISQTFKCIKYESPQINSVCKSLINKYLIIRDFLDFKTSWTPESIDKLNHVDINDWPTQQQLYENDYWDNGKLSPNKIAAENSKS